VRTPSSPYAAEGNAADWVYQKVFTDDVVFPGEKDPAGYPVDRLMIEHAYQFRAHVRAVVGDTPVTTQLKASAEFIHPAISRIYPDVCVVGDTAYVWDYKYGAGLAVEAEGNLQLLLYALALHPVARAVLVIYQPRAFHPGGPVRYWVVDRATLDWYAQAFRLAADRCQQPDAALLPGEHCKWCAGASMCPALHEEIDTLATLLDAPPAVDPASLGQRLAQLLRLETLVEAARQQMEQQGLQLANMTGSLIPGFKLVQKRTHRQLTDPDNLIALAPLFGVDTDVLYTEPKLRGIGELEAVLPKKLVDMCATKPQGDIALVPENDKRPAVAAQFITGDSSNG
jgi:hypothetical protein